MSDNTALYVALDKRKKLIDKAQDTITDLNWFKQRVPMNTHLKLSVCENHGIFVRLTSDEAAHVLQYISQMREDKLELYQDLFYSFDPTIPDAYDDTELDAALGLHEGEDLIPWSEIDKIMDEKGVGSDEPARK